VSDSGKFRPSRASSGRLRLWLCSCLLSSCDRSICWAGAGRSGLLDRPLILSRTLILWVQVSWERDGRTKSKSLGIVRIYLIHRLLIVVIMVIFPAIRDLCIYSLLWCGHSSTVNPKPASSPDSSSIGWLSTRFVFFWRRTVSEREWLWHFLGWRGVIEGF